MLITHSKCWGTMEKQMGKDSQEWLRCRAHMACSWLGENMGAQEEEAKGKDKDYLFTVGCCAALEYLTHYLIL